MGDPFHLSKTGYRSLTQEDKIQTSLLAGLSPPLLLFCTELRNTVHWKMLSANAWKGAIITEGTYKSGPKNITLLLEAGGHVGEWVQFCRCASICAIQRDQGCTPKKLYVSIFCCNTTNIGIIIEIFHMPEWFWNLNGVFQGWAFILLGGNAF